MEFIYVPFSWLLMTLYDLVKNYGIAIIIFAIIVKLILLPFGMKSKKSMMKSTRFTPRMKELEKKYEGNKQKYNEEVMKLYKEEGIKPMGGCLWSLIPFPILLILYSCIRLPFTRLMHFATNQWEYLKNTIFPALNIAVDTASKNAYEQISYAEVLHNNFDKVTGYVSEHAQDITDAVGKLPVLKDIDFNFLGLNLGQNPDWKFFLNMESWAPKDAWPAVGLFLIPIVSAVLAWLSMRIANKMQPQQDPANSTTKVMNLLMPIMSLWIGFVMPACMGIYWIIGSLFSIAQDVILTKHYNKILDREEAERKVIRDARAAELEAKRLETERLKAENATKVNPNTSRRKVQQKEKQKDEMRAAEWISANVDEAPRELRGGASRVDDRPFARGRAYVVERFGENADDPYAQESADDADSGAVKAIPENTGYAGTEMLDARGEITDGLGKEISDENTDSK